MEDDKGGRRWRTTTRDDKGRRYESPRARCSKDGNKVLNKLLRTDLRETSQLYAIAAVRTKFHGRARQFLRSTSSPSDRTQT